MLPYHITVKETEAQINEITCPTSQCQKATELRLEPRSKTCVLSTKSYGFLFNSFHLLKDEWGFQMQEKANVNFLIIKYYPTKEQNFVIITMFFTRPDWLTIIPEEFKSNVKEKKKSLLNIAKTNIHGIKREY